MHAPKIDPTFWAYLFNFVRDLNPGEIKHKDVEIGINNQQCTIPLDYFIYGYNSPLP